MRRAVHQVAMEAKGFMPDEEGLALHRIGLVAGDEGRGPFVEIGTYCAKSTTYLGEAARITGSVLFTVDHHRGSEEMQAGWDHHDPEVVDADGLMDTLPFARRTIAAAGLEDSVVLVVGRSADVGSQWGTPIGLLFIDGGHADPIVRADEAAWVPHVAPGALIALHDVFPDPADGGRPPFELFRRLLDAGFVEEPALACGSLRALRAPSDDAAG